MKNQALFSSKDKSKKKIKCRLLQFLFGDLRVNAVPEEFLYIVHNPFIVVRYVSVDSWITRTGASVAPAYDSCKTHNMYLMCHQTENSTGIFGIFTWIPSSNTQLFLGLHYDIHIYHASLASRLNAYIYSNGTSLKVALFILMANHLALLFLG